MIDRTADIAIIGAGSAGLAAYRAATRHTDRVVLIEGGEYGTTCARVGCMPSKLLIAAADAAHRAGEATRFGINTGDVRVDGRAVMARVRSERDRFAGFVVDAIHGLPASHRLRGKARFLDEHRLEVIDGERRTMLRAERIVIATGSVPVIPPLLQGLGDRLVINDDIFEWDDLPQRVAVFGPGVIGLELGQALSRLGVTVHMLGVGGGVGPLTDPAVRAAALAAFGEDFYLDPDASVISLDNKEREVDIDFIDGAGKKRSLPVDYVLAATGRRPAVAGLNLESTTLPLDAHGLPMFDPLTMQVGDSHVFIAGDATIDRPLLHEAADEGEIAGENAGRWPDVLPGHRRSPLGIVFTHPQIAMVGSRFAELGDSDVVIGAVDFADQGRSRVMLENRGRLRVYADASSGRFLGAEMIGPRAEHLAHLMAWAHQARMTVGDMLAMPFYHPVIEEGLRAALRDACRQVSKCGLRAA